MRAYPPRRLVLAVGTLAAAALGYEIVVARLLSITQEPPLGALLFVLATLGAAASGTVLSAFRWSGAAAFTPAFTLNALCFALSSLACAAAAGTAGVDPVALLDGLADWLGLILAGATLALPLLFAANGVVLAMQRHVESLAGVYAASLVGAGMGGIGVTAALFVVSPAQVLVVLALLGGSAGWVALLAAVQRPRWLVTVTLLGSLVLLLLAGRAGFEPVAGTNKAAARWLGVLGAHEVARRDSPLGRLQVVASPEVPLRHAPGLSLASRAAVPEQLAVFTDGEQLSVIDAYAGGPDIPAYLDQLPSALPYHLLAPRPSVLVLAPGGGSSVLQALAHQPARIDAVEPNPQRAGLVRDTFGAFAGHVYDDPRVVLHIADVRGFVRGAADRWNLIQLPLDAGPGPVVGAARGLGGSFAYTVEALADCLVHLEPGGLVAVTGRVRLPPRDGVKLFAMALAALERLQSAEPARRLAWIRSWQVTTLVLKNGVFSADELERIRRFDRPRGFDEAYLPDPKPAAPALRHALTRPYFTAPALALTGAGRGEFLQNYPYRVDPATDDRPYFFDFFRWPLLRQSWVLASGGGAYALDLGYPLQLATLALVLAIALALMLAPLAWLRQPAPSVPRRLFRTGVYFSLTGLGFMLTLLAAVEHFTQYLAHPVYAVPVVLAGLLVFGGIGSGLAARFPRRSARGRALLAAIAFAFLVLLQAWAAPLLHHSASVPLILKLLLVLGVIAPVALCLGLMVPLGMVRLTYEGAALVPWAFGLNRAGMAIGAASGALLAMAWGQAAVLPLAAACYVLAALAMP